MTVISQRCRVPEAADSAPVNVHRHEVTTSQCAASILVTERQEIRLALITAIHDVADAHRVSRIDPSVIGRSEIVPQRKRVARRIGTHPCTATCAMREGLLARRNSECHGSGDADRFAIAFTGRIISSFAKP
jgi:hypothetical protein